MRLTHLPLAAAMFVLFGSAAFAGDADFKLVNKTGYQIDNVWVSAHSAGSWGEDIMGKGSLGDGEWVTITFPHGGSHCHYDIKVKYNDGDEAQWGDVNLCNYEKISLFWDGKETRAEGE